MTTKKILVPCGPEGNLKSVHHALALAERLQAHVVILEWKGSADDRDPASTWFGDALNDVITNARMAGLSLSHLRATGAPQDEIVTIVDDEEIDLLVLGADQSQLEAAVLRDHPRLLGAVIRVKEKEAMDNSVEEGGWQ
jgi:nucleotide-binding universal stress UspA family protein